MLVKKIREFMKRPLFISTFSSKTIDILNVTEVFLFVVRYLFSRLTFLIKPEFRWEKLSKKKFLFIIGLSAAVSQAGGLQNARAMKTSLSNSFSMYTLTTVGSKLNIASESWPANADKKNYGMEILNGGVNLSCDSVYMLNLSYKDVGEFTVEIDMYEGGDAMEIYKQWRPLFQEVLCLLNTTKKTPLIPNYTSNVSQKIKNYKKILTEHTNEVSVLKMLVKFLHPHLRTPVALNSFLRLCDWMNPSLLVTLLKDITRYPGQHLKAYHTFVALFKTPSNYELFLSPHVHRIEHEPNELILSFSSNKRSIKFSNSSYESITESESDSDIAGFTYLNLHEKSIIALENSEAASNQDTNGTTASRKYSPEQENSENDTNGTTGPKKKNLKSVTSIEPSSISIESDTFKSPELFNNIRGKVYKLTTSSGKFSFEDSESLLHNDGTCNNAPNTEASKQDSNDDEPNLFLAYDSITYYSHKPKKGSTSKRPNQKKIEVEEDI